MTQHECNAYIGKIGLVRRFKEEGAKSGGGGVHEKGSHASRGAVKAARAERAGRNTDMVKQAGACSIASTAAPPHRIRIASPLQERSGFWFGEPCAL